MHLKNDDNEDESASRLDVAAKAAGIGVWEFDPISGRLDWDDRCRELFGISTVPPFKAGADSSKGVPASQRRKDAPGA